MSPAHATLIEAMQKAICRDIDALLFTDAIMRRVSRGKCRRCGKRRVLHTILRKPVPGARMLCRSCWLDEALDGNAQ